MKIASIFLSGFVLVWHPLAASQSVEHVISQIAPLSDAPAAAVGLEVVLGVKAAIEEANQRGGVNGLRIRHVVLDDKFKPDSTLALARQTLQKEKPAALIAMATANNLELVKNDIPGHFSTPLFPTRTGAPAVRALKNPYIFHSRAGFEEELNKLGDVLPSIGYRRVTVLYQRDAFGESGLQIFEAAARRVGSEIAARIGYDRNLSDMAQAVDAALKTDSTAVLMIASGAAGNTFVKSYRKAGGKQLLVGVSDLDLRALAASTDGSIAKGVAASQVIPNPVSATLRLASEYRRALERVDTAAKPNNASFEGYIVGRIIVEGLGRCPRLCDGRAMALALGSLKRFDLGGYWIDYSGGNRLGSSYSDLAIIGSSGAVVY